MTDRTAVADTRTRSELEDILTAAMDIAEEMLRVGAEVNRVEDTLSRICRAYGSEDVEVFSITSLIIASLRTVDGEVLTQTRRAKTRSTDLTRLENYNALSRYICASRPSAEEIREHIAVIRTGTPRRLIRDIAGYALAAGGFALFFGGNAFDGISAALIGLFIFLMEKRARPTSANMLIYTLLCSAVSGTAAALLCRIGLPINPDKVMIGDIMVLIPGMAITNSIRDLFCGDTMTGLLRLAESVVTSAAIAVGFAIPILIFGI